MDDEKASVDRRRSLKGTVTAAVAVPALAQDHNHDHAHQVVPSDPALRVKSLESLLVEKGLVDAAALDALVDTYENHVGPRNGAKVVAPRLDRRSLQKAPSFRCSVGHRGAGIFEYAGGEHMLAVENTAKGAQRCGLHAVFLLSVAGPESPAGLVQVLGISLKGGHRSTRRPQGVRTRPARGRRGTGMGQHCRTALHRAARASLCTTMEHE